VNSARHLAQADVILAGMRKLTMPGDYLAIVDGAMVAGYHLGNALLHVHGISADSEHTNTPSKLERGIDTLRLDYVRSASVYDPRVATEVWRCLEVMEHACAAR
jgi:hypothetical protein